MTPPDPRYPVGAFEPLGRPLSREERTRLVDALEAAPAALRGAVDGLDAEQLDTPYREGGWTVRQVAHHVPDSHLNAYVRFRWALTEDAPLIKPYDEKGWARLPDAVGAPVEPSLLLLEALHARWVLLLRALDPTAFRRIVRHPDFDHPLSADTLLELYAWHGRHHVAHVTALRERQGW